MVSSKKPRLRQKNYVDGSSKIANANRIQYQVIVAIGLYLKKLCYLFYNCICIVDYSVGSEQRRPVPISISQLGVLAAFSRVLGSRL
jgi:hypothetical protein